MSQARMASVRGPSTHNLRCVIAAIALLVGAPAFAAPQAANTAAAIEPDAAEATPVTPAAPKVESAPLPTNSRARPLGPMRDARPAVGTTTSDQSALAAIWNNPVVRTGGSLALVLVLIVALAAITKRLAAKSGLAGQLGAAGRAPEGLLEVLGRYPLSRGQTLILLKVDSRVLLLSQTTPRIRGGVGTLTTLCEIADPEDVASILVKAGEHAGDASAAKFNRLLHKFDRTHDQHLPDHTEIEVKGRRIQKTVSGDRSEMLDDQALPTPAAAGIYQQPFPAPQAPAVIHKFPHPTELPLRENHDSFSTIRQRLHALHGEAHR